VRQSDRVACAGRVASGTDSSGDSSGRTSSGGTIALVSQNYGGDAGRASQVVSASVVLMVVVAIPVAVLFGLGAGPLVGMVASDPATAGFGATYLAFVVPGLFFEGLNLVASRTYAGVGDTITPMAIRVVGALGVLALQLALVVETLVPMIVNVARFRTGTWKVISREYRPDAGAGIETVD